MIPFDLKAQWVERTVQEIMIHSVVLTNFGDGNLAIFTISEEEARKLFSDFLAGIELNMKYKERPGGTFIIDDKKGNRG